MCLLTAKVKNQGDFNQFVEDYYDPQNPVANQYRLTTLPILAEGEVADPIEPSIGLGAKADEDRRRAFDGTPGSYSITNSLGEVVSSGSYTAGKPIAFAGMTFLLKGAPGAAVDISLDKPRRDNVLNEINDTLAVLSDLTSSNDERQTAFLMRRSVLIMRKGKSVKVDLLSVQG